MAMQGREEWGAGSAPHKELPAHGMIREPARCPALACARVSDGHPVSGWVPPDADTEEGILVQVSWFGSGNVTGGKEAANERCDTGRVGNSRREHGLWFKSRASERPYPRDGGAVLTPHPWSVPGMSLAGEQERRGLPHSEM